jgi:hypothetical protein
MLRQHHVAEAPGEAIDDRHDVVAMGNGKPAARTEVVLDVDDQKDVAVGDWDGHHCARGYRIRLGAASCA